MRGRRPPPHSTPSGVTELHPHATADGWLLENPGWLSGGAYRWFRDELGSVELSRAAATGADVYELLNDAAASVPPGRRRRAVGARARRRDRPGVEPRRPRGVVRVDRRPRPLAHMARALLEGNAFALRDVIEAMGSAGLEAREIVCVGGGARGELLLQHPGRHHRSARDPTRGRRDDRARGCDARRRRRGPAPRSAHRGAADGLAATRGHASRIPSASKSTPRPHTRATATSTPHSALSSSGARTRNDHKFPTPHHPDPPLANGVA